MSRFELKESDFSFNASIDPFLVLKKMGFTDHSMYVEGEIVRVHCPIHRDLVRKSLIIDVVEKTYKCQYANCEAHEGGLLIELVALYYDCDIRDVSKALFGEENKSADLLFRGEMFINQGRHQEALPYLEQAVDMSPRDEITRCKLAALYLELHRKDDAYREYLNAAESYAVRGELDKTLSIYNILIMLQPGAVKARKELAFLFSRIGRPDAAAEQIKWVVDFYMKYNQVRGAQEACEQIIELDPENSMGYFILGTLHRDAGKRVEAVQNFESACRFFMAENELSRAETALHEAMSLAPGNNRLRELRDELDNTVSELGEDFEAQAVAPLSTEGEEEEFISWLNEVDQKLARGEDISLGAAEGGEPASEADEIPMFQEMPDAPGGEGSVLGEDSQDINPDDRRVALCLNDMKELDSEQVEAMRQQLVGMFTDVRRSYEEGTLSDWEMRTIKDFYKSFCVAVDVLRKEQQPS